MKVCIVFYSCGCFWRANYKGGAYSGAEILVGEDYQAVIPDYKPCSAREGRDYPDKDFLLWSPNSFQDSECKCISQGNLLICKPCFLLSGQVWSHSCKHVRVQQGAGSGHAVLAQTPPSVIPPFSVGETIEDLAKFTPASDPVNGVRMNKLFLRKLYRLILV